MHYVPKHSDIRTHCRMAPNFQYSDGPLVTPQASPLEVRAIQLQSSGRGTGVGYWGGVLGVGRIGSAVLIWVSRHVDNDLLFAGLAQVLCSKQFASLLTTCRGRCCLLSCTPCCRYRARAPLRRRVVPGCTTVVKLVILCSPTLHKAGQ